MHRFMLISVLLLSLLSAGALAGALERDATVSCPPAPPGAVIDGNLDEVFWQVPPVISRFVNIYGRTPNEATQAWAAYGRKGVYFAFSCEQEKMSPDNSPTRKEVWLDDSVEVFVDTNGDRKTYGHFLLSAAGAKMYESVDAAGNRDRESSVPWEGAAEVGEGRWTAEIFVPYSSLGAELTEGSVLRANLCRNNAAVGENSCWSASYGGFHQPLAFGNLVMGVPAADLRFSVNAGEKLEEGPARIKVWCLNESPSDLGLTATLFPLSKELKSDKPLMVSAGRQLTAYVDANLDTPGLVNLKLAAVSAESGKTLGQASFGGTVAAAPPPAAGGIVASGKWGTLWNSTATYKVMRDTTAPAGKLKAVKISAARNEFEPFQLVLLPKDKIDGVQVTPHTLTGPGGARIEAWNISVRNVGYVHVSEPTSIDAAPGMYPDPLPEFEPFSAPAGVNSPVWVTVYVPRDTPPGDYAGTVDVSGEGMDDLKVPVNVHVWDFALPSVSSLRTAYGWDLNRAAYYQDAKTVEEKRKLTELYNLNFWRHRISPYRPYTFYDVKASIEGGGVKLDFTDFDIAVRKFFALFNSYNFPHFEKGNTAGLDMGGDYPRLKVDYMRAVAEHLVNKGQIEKGYNYIFDEPTPEQYESLNEEAKLCRMADRRIKVLLTEQVEPELVGSVDIWVPVLPNYDEQAAKERQAAGEEVWWYVCCGPHHPYPNNFIDYPAIDQRILPWITWRYGVNGILYWNTMYWRDNPYEIAMSYTPDGKGRWGNGDGRLLYPPVRQPAGEFVAKGPVPSIRWELIREGVEDYDYFHILKSKADSARAAGQPQAGLAQAQEALKLVNECAQSRTQYTKDPAELERVRVSVAEAIEALR